MDDMGPTPIDVIRQFTARADCFAVITVGVDGRVTVLHSTNLIHRLIYNTTI